MSVPRWIRPAAPVGVAVMGLAVVVAVAATWLPLRVVVIRTTDGAGAAFASRSDLLLVAVAVAVVILIAYLVSAAALAWTPARHLLVPRASYWKHETRRRELRRRLASYLARGTAAGLWFVAALIVVALVGQSGGPGATWWIPLAVSLVYVVGMLVWLSWVLTGGFAPPRRSAQTGTAAAGSTTARAPGGAVQGASRRSPPRDGPPRDAPARAAQARAAQPRPAQPGPDQPRAVGGRAASPVGRTSPQPGEHRRPGEAGPSKSPPRPYQPSPRPQPRTRPEPPQRGHSPRD